MTGLYKIPEQKNLWNYYAVAPWSDNQEAKDHRLRYWVRSLALGIFTLGLYPAILGLVMLGEKVAHSLHGRVGLQSVPTSIQEKTKEAGAILNLPASVHKLIAQPTCDVNKVVRDLRYYPLMLSVEDQNEIRSKYNSHIKGATFGEYSLVAEEEIKLNPSIPLDERKDIDYKGKLVMNNRSIVGYLGTNFAENQPNFSDHFERIDGVNWRQFPGDLLIQVQFSDVQEKKPMGWKNIKAPLLGSYTRETCLPVQLFLGKKIGDTVEFLYKNKRYAFQIEQQCGVKEVLDRIIKNAVDSESQGESYYLGDPHKYISHQIVKDEQASQIAQQLLEKTYKDYGLRLGEEPKVKLEILPKEFSQVSSEEDQKYIEMLRNEPVKVLGSSLSDYSAANFDAYEIDNYRNFIIEMPGVINFWIIEGKTTLAIIGQRREIDKIGKNHLLVLDFQNDKRLKSGSSPSKDWLENIEAERGHLRFKVKLYATR